MNSDLPGQMHLFAADATPTNLSLTASAVLDLEAKDATGAPKLPTFNILAYTGAPMSGGVLNPPSPHPVIVDLAGIKATSQRIPILLDHDRTRIIGQTDGIRIDSSGVHLTGTITGDDADSAKVVTHAKRGFEWKASIGAPIARAEFLKTGQKAVVNGQEITGPFVIAREAHLKETSFVAIGGDTQTIATVAASQSLGTPKKGAPSMFEKWLEAKGFKDPSALDDAQRASLQAMYDAEMKAKETPREEKTVKAAAVKDKPNLDDLLNEIQAEEDRKNQITEMCAEAARERPMLLDEFKRIGDMAIEAKSPVSEVKLAILQLRASAHGSFAVHSRERKASASVIEAALAISAGLENPEKSYDQTTLNAASDRFPHGLGLRDVFLMAARENGYHGPTGNDLEAVLAHALPPRHVRASGGFSTFSLGGTLSNIANKFVAQSFDAVESAWRSLSAFRNARDFKTMTSYALTGDLMYEQIAPTGEIKHGTLGELSYTNQLKSYGRMLAITRVDMINDDLGAFARVPMRLGRGGALKINDVFWTEFLGGVGSFWAAGNANLITGATTVLSDAGLTQAQIAFRKQTDPDGLPTAIMPRILLVPPEVEITADQLMTATAVNTGGASTETTVPNVNTWRGKYRVVSSVYLSNSAYTGYSTTAWFLLSDPNDLPTIEVAFLNGRQRPIVEQAEADFNVLGVQMRAYHDFGVSLQEYRASVRSAGA